MTASDVNGRVPSTGTESANRVADVILLFLRSRSFGVTAMARELGLSKAVVHRILQSLESRQLIDYDASTRGYRLGTAMASLGARALQDLDLRAAALPTLQRLQEETRETATLSALVGSSRVYVDQLPSRQEITMTVEIGRGFPLHAGASGRVILAHIPVDLRHAILEERLTGLTEVTITDRHVLASTLEEIRRHGYALSRGERQHGAGSVAAPLFGPGGRVVGAISVCGPINRFDDVTMTRLAPLVRDAAIEISAAIGGGDAHDAQEARA